MKKNSKYALVTGGTSGIGYELSKLLAQDGYSLILVARDELELRKVSDEFRSNYSSEVVTISKDLFDPDNAFALYDEIALKGIEI